MLLPLAPCTGTAPADGLLPLLRQAHAQLGNGAPGTAGLLAQVAEARAQALAAEGHARAALQLLTFTLGELDLRAVPERVPPFQLPPSEVATDGLGSEQRNLLRAAELAQAAHQPGLAMLLRAHAETAPR